MSEENQHLPVESINKNKISSAFDKIVSVHWKCRADKAPQPEQSGDAIKAKRLLLQIFHHLNDDVDKLVSLAAVPWSSKMQSKKAVQNIHVILMILENNWNNVLLPLLLGEKRDIFRFRSFDLDVQMRVTTTEEIKVSRADRRSRVS